jgi:hypothetical protein
MPLSLQPISEIKPELLLQLSGDDRFVTHAHNPCLLAILQKTFGWKGAAFLVLEDQKPVGYFSCMMINGRMVSMPHFSYGGLLTTHPDRKELFGKLLPLLNDYFGKEAGASLPYLVRDYSSIGNYVVNTKIISWIDIADRNQDDVIPAPQMSRVRKALKAGLTSKNGGPELLGDFYSVYSRNMLRLGSPVLPLKLFRNILEGYHGGTARVVCVYIDNKPVGAGFLMSYAGFFENTWFSTLSNYNHLYPAQLLHHEMIGLAVQEGGHTYSFGRSTAGSGVHEFKRRWNTNETIVYWNYDKPVTSDLRKARFLSQLWKYLPLRIANAVGPLVSGRVY